jgi:hypothetical protein
MTSEHLDDDALSASLDGEATPGELAHLDGCDTCRARVDELRTAANLVGSPVPPVDVDAREAAIAAALVAQPTPIHASPRYRPPAWLLAAAAVIAVVALVGVFASTGTKSSQVASRDASSAADQSTASKLAPSAESGSTFSAREGAGPDLGTFTAGEALRDRVLAALPGDATTSTTTASADSNAAGSATAAGPCVAELTAQDTTLGAVVLDARATVDGTEARIVVFRVPDGSTPTLRAYAAAVDDCRVLRSEAFPAP